MSEFVIVFDPVVDEPWSYRVPEDKVLPTLKSFAALGKRVIEVRPATTTGDTP